MTVIDNRSVLSGIKVREAMRRQVVRLDRNAPVAQAIRYFIKYKVNALLVVEEDFRAAGVASKTDVMGAYYAGLPLETPLEAILFGPPLFCEEDDTLESALGTMRERGIYRLYVRGEEPDATAGVLAYPDIVGMLYRYCRRCAKNIFRHRKPYDEGDGNCYLKVREIMTPSVKAHGVDETLAQVMEGLSEYRVGAVLVRDRQGRPAGVISKSDLMIAYKHGVPWDTPAGEVMGTPVFSCHQEELLARAIQSMIYRDVHRLFVHSGDPGDVAGVFSLSDAARARSGSCRACIPSRIQVE